MRHVYIVSRTLPLLLLFLGLPGCTKDVTHDPAHRGDLLPGQTYRLVRDVFIGRYRPHMLLPQGDFHSGVPASIREYELDSGRWRGGVLGVASAGTELQVVAFRLHTLGFRYVDVHATLTTGPHAGTEVLLNSITKTDHVGLEDIVARPGGRVMRDPDYLAQTGAASPLAN